MIKYNCKRIWPKPNAFGVFLQPKRVWPVNEFGLQQVYLHGVGREHIIKEMEE